MARGLTQGQRVVLGIVAECGPITAAELAYHLSRGGDNSVIIPSGSDEQSGGGSDGREK